MDEIPNWRGCVSSSNVLVTSIVLLPHSVCPIWHVTHSRCLYTGLWWPGRVGITDPVRDPLPTYHRPRPYLESGPDLSGLGPTCQIVPDLSDLYLTCQDWNLSVREPEPPPPPRNKILLLLLKKIYRAQVTM